YDPWGRMTVRQVPGAEPLLMVYDLDRLVLTQDGNQRLVNEWTFTKYDVLNRPILTGIYSHGSAISQADMQAFLNNYYGSNPSYRFESRGSTVHGYTNQLFPNVSSEVDYLTVTYYDDYQFGVPSELEYKSDELLGQGTVESGRVKGHVTGGKAKNLADNSWYLTVNYYDDRYRVIQSVSQNHKGGLDRSTNVYDFPGRIIASKTTHQVAGATERSVTRTYEYD